LSVFVIDKRKKPLMPCSEKRARQLLERRRAVVHRLHPFTIRLKDRVGGDVQPVRIKLDPRSQGGSNRVLNLCLACEPCNRRKGARPVEVFVTDPKVLAEILKQAKAPLKDAAAVNATRWELFRRLQAIGLPVETGSGGRTKWNRTRLDIPKSHALDAACVGDVDAVSGWQVPVLKIEAKGRGQYQRTNVTAHGFPNGYFMSRRMVRGFRTGDIVKAVVLTGKKIGTYLGRVAVRKTGDFKVKTANGPVDHLSWKACTVQQRADGYAYSLGETIVKSVQYVADLLHPTAQAGGSRKSERMCLVPG